MKIKYMTLFVTMISAFYLQAQVTMPLSECEIKSHMYKKEKMHSVPGGNFYPRQYAKIPGNDLREKLTREKSLKWALSEALVNTVVRTLTKGLRQNDGKRKNKVVVWKAERGKFSFEYRVVVKNSIIVREECVLKFSGMSVLKTRNGKMAYSPNITQRELSRAIKILKKSDLKAEYVRVGVRCKKDIAKTGQMLDYLGIDENAMVYISCRDSKTVPDVKIKFNTDLRASKNRYK
jgi:hypothetical protein